MPKSQSQLKPDQTLENNFAWVGRGGGPRAWPPEDFSASHWGRPSCPLKAHPSQSLMAGTDSLSNSISIVLQMKTLRPERGSDLQSWSLGLQTPSPVLLLPCCLLEQWSLDQVEHRIWSELRGMLTSSRMLGTFTSLRLSVLICKMGTVLPASCGC